MVRVILLYVPGSETLLHADIGYAYGYLLSSEIKETYFSLLHSLIPGSSLENQELRDLVALALDWQWKDYLVRV